jgi:hypothetical protein
MKVRLFCIALIFVDAGIFVLASDVGIGLIYTFLYGA